jgi:acyl carrier protein
MKDMFLEAFKEALELEDVNINWSDTFRDYDEWDSIARLSLIAFLDEEFDIQIEDEEFEKLKTVEDLWQSVQKQAG